MHSARSAADKNIERRSRLRRRSGSSQPGSLQNCLQLASAHHRIDLGNVAANLVPKALHEASGNDQPPGFPAIRDLVLRHLQNRVHRLLLGRVDEAACVDDQNLRVLGARGQLAAGAVKQPHHHLGVHQIFRTAQRDEADSWPRGDRRPRRRGTWLRGSYRGFSFLTGDRVRHTFMVAVHTQF